ncbi:acyl-CoA N-acyltransferase [Decorospora gaudefroyi]|uniref:Acyl-CoA N-acyltransferase n=1 Tax=Decorospora gaudefroyi TaxID=184978 RepID=A0A6A5K4D8_9PLEO|nr:acyl-CoA N-acyltransferase [Decorospora gaudefroyi]
MPIRPPAPSEEPAMAALLATAFFEESLFGQTIHPYRHAHPADVKIFWSEKVRKAWSTPNQRLLVATTTLPENGSEEKITGVAIWERQGDDEGRKVVEREWVGVDPQAFPPLPPTNNAISPTKRTILTDAYPFFSHFWHGSRAQNWYLEILAVHPDHAGQGFGRELVTWGLDRARKEGVHASVVASEGADAFYLKCGFGAVVGNCTVGVGNPLLGVGGGDVLFMVP